jgi:hypothetical protein
MSKRLKISSMFKAFMIHILELEAHIGHKGQRLIIVSNGTGKMLSPIEKKCHELIDLNLNSLYFI